MTNKNTCLIKFLKCLCLICLIDVAFTDNLFSTGTSSQNTKSAKCVLKLSEKYFVQRKALKGSIVIINIPSYTSNTEALILETLHIGKKYSIMVKNGFHQHANASHFPEKAKNYMIILQEKSDLAIHLDQLRSLPSWNPLAKSVAYYQLKPNENDEKAAINLINAFREFKILKSIILMSSSQEGYITAYSWSPYSDVNCGGICKSVYILDKCKDNEVKQFEPQREMFPLDLKGCPLIICAVVSEPYVMPPERKVKNIIWNDAYEFQKGGEINLVKIISQFTNMSLVIRVSDKEENWGTIYPDGKATGAYGVLRNDSVDLVIGNIQVTRTIRKWFHPTISYTQDEMTFCVPRAKKAATWNNLIIIFQWSTWVATLISIIIMGVVFHYMYYKERKPINTTKWPTNSILMTFSMLLGWGATFEPKSSAFRILIFVWLCFSLNMAISYESFLRSFLIHPRFEKQISTESDLIQSGIPLGGREIYRSYFETNNASGFYLYRKYSSITFSEGIRKAALDRNFAVVSSRKQAEYMDQKLGKGAALIYCFPESDNLYKYGVVLLARQWFPMMDKFNNIIRSVSENGLIHKWNEELIIHKISSESAGTILPLSMQHLLGAFMLIGILYTVSAIVFVGEIAVGMPKCSKCSTIECVNIRW